jgi:hypothetical protein
MRIRRLPCSSIPSASFLPGSSLIPLNHRRKHLALPVPKQTGRTRRPSNSTRYGTATIGKTCCRRRWTPGATSWRTGVPRRRPNGGTPTTPHRRIERKSRAKSGFAVLSAQKKARLGSRADKVWRSFPSTKKSASESRNGSIAIRPALIPIRTRKLLFQSRQQSLPAVSDC